MKPEKKPDPVWLYALGVLLALAVRLIDHKTANYTLSTLCFGVVLLLDAGMLLAWLYSVRRRLLHSRARGCIVAAVMLWGCVRLAWQLKKRRRLFAVFIPLAFMLLYQPISVIPAVLFRARILHMPQFCIFCMVCFFECCIRLRLIPYNENYAAFFGGMRLPAVITDRALEPVFATSQPVSASPEQFVKSLEAPVYLTRDLRLSGRPLKAGNVFYTEDETELHRMNARFAKARPSIDSVKEAVDSLPVGVCFVAENGTVALMNLRMNEWCIALTGQPLSDGNAFVSAMYAAAGARGEKKE